MFFSDEITLRSVVYGADSDGYSTATNTDTTVFANESSVTRSEFYSANANKINIVKVYEIHAEDWGNQTQVVVGSDVYYIVRDYRKGQGIVELSCSDRAA